MWTSLSVTLFSNVLEIKLDQAQMVSRFARDSKLPSQYQSLKGEGEVFFRFD